MHRSSFPSMPPLGSGHLLGDKFAIEGVLGEGGAGIVYDAVRLPEHERIALKVLHAHLLGDRQIRGRFEREAKILRRLEGPHVCPILEFGEVPDPRREGQTILFMALPKIDGPSLDVVLRREGPLPIPRALDIMLQVCDALKMAHAQGVIHRDLKPANVLLRGGNHVIVVDFGLAKIIVGDTAETVLTAHNMVCGTPEYMAPEQARGDAIDARGDVYAAGIMLYELLTGVVPFSGQTPLSVLTAHLTAEAIPPRERAPERGISIALEAVVMHAIAKLPEMRYPSASALAAAILHARARPDDRASVRPDRFRVDVDGDGTDEHAHTIPADTPIRAEPPSAPVTPPSPLTLSAPQTSGPSQTPGSPNARSAPPRRVSDGASLAEPSEFLGPRGWTLVWIVAAAIGISIGVWLSLHR